MSPYRPLPPEVPVTHHRSDTYQMALSAMAGMLLGVIATAYWPWSGSSELPQVPDRSMCTETVTYLKPGGSATCGTATLFATWSEGTGTLMMCGCVSETGIDAGLR